jgi:hypothetical protein
MTDSEKHDQDFPSKFTVYVVICWILAAFGGFMFGYDIGISGMQSLRKKNRVKPNTLLHCNC